eukprot:2384044-Pleurochrysis_carterae.AAC.3
MERPDGWGPCQDKARSIADGWRLNKPVVFGEMPTSVRASGENGKPLIRTAADILQCIGDGGFGGGMFWAYNDNGTPMLDAVDELEKFRRQRPEATSFEVSYATSSF